jgi:hypothetical protein
MKGIEGQILIQLKFINNVGPDTFFVTKIDELMTLCQFKTRITEANRLSQQLADEILEEAVA